MHGKLLAALDVLDLVCREFDIRYSLHGGTLLGAERDHHLIPWDDDMDVSMRRDDFDAFQEIVRGGWLGDGFLLDDSTLWVSRFVMKSHTSPVYIDIFIWDYISEHRLSRFLKINLLRFIQGMMKTDIHYSDYHWTGKLLVLLSSSFGRLFSQKAKRKMYRFAEQKIFLGQKRYIHRSNDSYRGITYIHDSDYMSNYKEIELEGQLYFVNERYREFLVEEYGKDYLIPPDRSAKKPAHQKILEKIQQNSVQ